MPIIPQPFLTMLTKFLDITRQSLPAWHFFLAYKNPMLAAGSSSPSGQLEQSGKGKGGACKDGCFGERQQMDLLLIGLGGGALPMCVNMSIKYIPNVSCISLYMYAVVSSGFHIGLFDVSFFTFIYQ